MKKAHQCRGPEICEPKFVENLLAHIKNLLGGEVEEQTTAEEKAKMCVEHRKAYEVEAEEEARKAINREALKQAKDKKVQTERKQREDQLRREITAEITAGRVAADAKQ